MPHVFPGAGGVGRHRVCSPPSDTLRASKGWSSGPITRSPLTAVTPGHALVGHQLQIWMGCPPSHICAMTPFLMGGKLARHKHAED